MRYILIILLFCGCCHISNPILKESFQEYKSYNVNNDNCSYILSQFVSTVYIPNSYLERNLLLQLEDNYIDYIYQYGISINYPIMPSENELKVVDSFLDDIINKENDMEINIGYITEFIEIINCYEFEKAIRN